MGRGQLPGCRVESDFIDLMEAIAMARAKELAESGPERAKPRPGFLKRTHDTL